MKNVIFLLFFLITCTEIFPQNIDEKFKSFSWLEGSWENFYGGRHLFEIWEKLNDSIMVAKSFAIKNNDTVSFESIRLEKINNEIFYIPTVKNQNDNKPVKFKLVSYDDKAVF